MKKFVIFSMQETLFLSDEPIFWSNEDGWGSLESATVFSEDEVIGAMMVQSDALWLQLPEYKG
jgi:hypothetical protein